MIEKLNRKLLPGEDVHHSPDKDRTNNSPENLEVMTRGKHVAIHNSERIISDKTREKMSKSRIGNKRRLGKFHSEETIALMSKSHLGHAPSFTGPHTEETKKIISQKGKESWANDRRRD